MKKKVDCCGSAAELDLFPIQHFVGRLFVSPGGGTYMLADVSEGFYSLINVADGECWDGIVVAGIMKRELEKHFKWFVGRCIIEQEKT